MAMMSSRRFVVALALALMAGPAAALCPSLPSSRQRAAVVGRKAVVRMGVGNSFGRLFRISTWGESHGGGVGVTVDGCPPRLPITTEEIQLELTRRRPGQSRLTTPRDEQDLVEILSGVVDGVALGTPIGLLVRNKDQRSNDYEEMALKYRPSHADATYDAKYGVRAVAGGGRSSARETIGRVAAGAIAKKILKTYSGMEVLCYVKKVQELEAVVDPETVTFDEIEANIARCPDAAVADQMIERIDTIRKQGNSIGGVVECIVRNVPAGLGAPVFDKLEADLAKACMSLPAAKGFEVGSGFGGTLLTGREHNDPFYVDAEGRTRTKSNRSGGIQGGISNGETIILRVAFKPTSTISQEQETVTRGGEETRLRGKGRHDPCVLPRACPMVDAMVAVTLVDSLMMQHAQCDLLSGIIPLQGEPSNALGKSLKPVVPELPKKKEKPAEAASGKGPKDVYAEEN
eukprot:CAMPEP_0172585584 /NCGR_PEP_ID=MMETSP1068-20121228/4996_1 /TAXON_ID=35684 /ORGANISM="Pseudopedinella elastica, Strain CCMP716" /LENGTH=459 /DNA_ID=CAMNT_0013380099 /DNA_START=16 /DNA_END=1395 /DNA_ORIENTATION=-